MPKRRPVFHVRKRVREKSTVLAEIDHIVARACVGEGSIVTVHGLLFFSTDTQDAWMLDPEDGLAALLCKAGTRKPVNVVEQEDRFTVEWTHDYALEEECFVAIEKQNARLVRILGYPVEQIREAQERMARPLC